MMARYRARALCVALSWLVVVTTSAFGTIGGMRTSQGRAPAGPCWWTAVTC
jgi:hypothetical protein